MSKAIKPGELAAAIQKELAVYSEGVVERVNAAGQESSEKLRKLTKASAPRRKGKGGGSFRRNIAIKALDAGSGMKKFVWYVKPPDHRLTHLLVHGHATVDGDRTKANPFLENALDVVLPEYEKAVEEAVKNG